MAVGSVPPIKNWTASMNEPLSELPAPIFAVRVMAQDEQPVCTSRVQTVFAPPVKSLIVSNAALAGLATPRATAAKKPTAIKVRRTFRPSS